jgi:hypothetical protein
MAALQRLPLATGTFARLKPAPAGTLVCIGRVFAPDRD